MLRQQTRGTPGSADAKWTHRQKQPPCPSSRQTSLPPGPTDSFFSTLKPLVRRCSAILTICLTQQVSCNMMAVGQYQPGEPLTLCHPGPDLHLALPAWALQWSGVLCQSALLRLMVLCRPPAGALKAAF